MHPRAADGSGHPLQGTARSTGVSVQVRSLRVTVQRWISCLILLSIKITDLLQKFVVKKQISAIIDFRLQTATDDGRSGDRMQLILTQFV
jgi:hypothetical protein